MLGLYVFGLIFVYVMLWSMVFKRVRPWWAKALVVVVAVLIPKADVFYGRMKLKRMCEAEGGLRIYRVVEGVDGFERVNSLPYAEWVKKYGYKFIEGEGRDGKPMRLSRNPDGSIRQELNVTLKSEYSFGTSSKSVNDIYYRNEYIVRHRDSGEVIGKFTNIGFKGGWFERFLGGSSVACYRDNMSIYEFVRKVLKPIDRESKK